MLLPRPGKAYVRPETTKSRTYAGIEDIIEVRLAHVHSSMCLICTQVLNDIHEVIIDKVSGRFVNVKKDVRLGRYAMLKDAADDFRAMQQERCALHCLPSDTEAHSSAATRITRQSSVCRRSMRTTVVRWSIVGVACIRLVGT